jgi:hypothetical protein
MTRPIARSTPTNSADGKTTARAVSHTHPVDLLSYVCTDNNTHRQEPRSGMPTPALARCNGHNGIRRRNTAQVPFLVTKGRFRPRPAHAATPHN